MNFRTKTIALLMAAAVTASCSGDGGRKGSEPLVIDNSLTEEEIAAGILTPEVLWKMGRLGESTLSPDGKTVLYSVTWYNMAENRGVTNLFTVPSAGGEATQLTDNGGSDFAPAWSADGKTIYFLSDRSGDNQLWAMNADGSKMRQLSHIEGGLEGFGVAPTGDRFFYVQSVHAADTQGKDIYPDMDKSGVLIYSDLMARHWNYWDRGSYRHIFVGDLTAKEAKTGTDIMAGEAWDAPMAPYFDMSEIVWNNAGTQIAYTSKKLTGTEYATTTDSDKSRKLCEKFV